MEVMKRFKFWIIIGLLVLVSGVVFAVGFIPSRKRNSAQLADWKVKVDNVGKLVGKKLHSEEDIEQTRQLTEQYRQDLGELKGMLKERADLLQQYIPDPETNEGRPMEGGEWKLVYAAAMKALGEEVAKSFKSASPGLVIANDYSGGIWPSAAEMRSAAKDYWLQRCLFEALASANDRRMVVPEFSRFGMRTAPERLLHPAHGELFQPIGFEMQIATEFGSIPFVLEHLLKCEIPLNVTSLAVSRRGAGSSRAATSARGGRLVPGRSMGAPAGYRGGPPAGYRGGPPAGYRGGPPANIPRGPGAAPGGTTSGTTRPATRAETGQQAAAPSLVSVTIRGYVLDYKGE